MKFFWGYVIGFVSVLLISSYFVSIRDEEFIVDGTRVDGTRVDGTEGSNTSLDTAFGNAKTNNSFVEYHVSEDILRKSTQHNLKGMNLIDENGVQVVMDFEPTQVFPVYYTPGLYLYGASPFVPSYEESVKLSQIKPLLKKNIAPLNWSWSPREEDLIRNHPNPKDLKPIVKEDIPFTGIIPTGYFRLPKSKTDVRSQMGMIPEGYYIYDETNMAQIPPGFLASVDKAYILRKSEATQSMIQRYSPTDLTTY